ncbi:alanine racemase [Microbacterium hydrocarbonoxydans]|uniref:alanine racemase n=1 Tax=Microbacterium hydrocarbonoxydans TaxID=273678 RepID=UPI0020401C5E|nr:alanine racemase [Microbacterium hydrocarbonoxydans]MCM3778326.1 alanine racemase [Microbacterium hydrocarbonoxydans]
MTLAAPVARLTLSRLHAPTLETIPAAVAANVTRMRTSTRSRIMAVVKADGYGLGALTVARAALAAGADWLGVTDALDGGALRAAGIEAPILAWLNPAGVDAAQAAADRIDIAVGSLDELRQLVADTVPGAPLLRVHLHLDTGMTRGGVPLDDWAELLRAARAASDRIRVVGVMGHLPRADDADPVANAAAVLRMRHGRDAVLRAGFGPLLVHLTATSGTLSDPTTHFDLVRVGAGLVGIDPSETVELHGAARLTASVVHSSAVAAGTSVGYGGAFVTERPTHLAVIGVGYADGIPRELGPGAAVAIDGIRCPLVGRVSMDQIIVDTGDRRVPRGASAVVFGPEGGAVPSVQEWARWAGTIPHTIVTGVGARVRRAIAGDLAYRRTDAPLPSFEAGELLRCAREQEGLA